MKVQTPQAFDFKLIWDMHQKAIEQGSLGAWDNSSMLTQIGEKVYFSEGSDLNLKINTIEDVEMFRALYKMKHPEEDRAGYTQTVHECVRQAAYYIYS